VEKGIDRIRVATVTACCIEHGNDSGAMASLRHQGMLGCCYGDITSVL